MVNFTAEALVDGTGIVPFCSAAAPPCICPARTSEEVMELGAPQAWQSLRCSTQYTEQGLLRDTDTTTSCSTSSTGRTTCTVRDLKKYKAGQKHNSKLNVINVQFNHNPSLLLLLL